MSISWSLEDTTATSLKTYEGRGLGDSLESMPIASGGEEAGPYNSP